MKKQEYLNYHWPPTDIKFNHEPQFFAEANSLPSTYLGYLELRWEHITIWTMPHIWPFPGMARKDAVLSETMDISVIFSLLF